MDAWERIIDNFPELGEDEDFPEMEQSDMAEFVDPYDKPSLDELVHYGVPGMKWGRRKAGGGGVKTTSIQRTREIQGARSRQSALKNKEKTAKASGDFNKAGKLRDKRLNSKDRATALKLTRGEKVLSVLVGGGAVGGAFIAGRTIASRRAAERAGNN